MRFIKALVVLVIWVPWLVSAEEAPEAEDIPEKVSLKVSVQGGAFNAKFKFFDASEGCPSYVDIPGAKHYLGGVRASDSGATKKLKRESPVHILMFSPRNIHIARTTLAGVKKFKFGVEGASLYRDLQANFFRHVFGFWRFLRAHKPRHTCHEHNQSFYKTHVVSHVLNDALRLPDRSRALNRFTV